MQKATKPKPATQQTLTQNEHSEEGSRVLERSTGRPPSLPSPRGAAAWGRRGQGHLLDHLRHGDLGVFLEGVHHEPVAPDVVHTLRPERGPGSAGVLPSEQEPGRAGSGRSTPWVWLAVKLPLSDRGVGVLPGLPEPSLLCLQYGDSDPYLARLCAKWAGLTLAILSLTSEVQRRGQDRSPVVCVSLLGGWASGPCALCSAVPHATPCPREC